MKFKIWFEHWISGWLDMLCGLISVITFCYYRPWWDFKFRIWTAKKNMEYKVNKLKKEIK